MANLSTRLRGRNLEDLRQSRLQIESLILDKNREIQSRQNRVTFLKEKQSPELYNKYLQVTTMDGSSKLYFKELATKSPTLCLAIYKKIKESDMILLIAGINDQYRSWMDFELLVAAYCHRPIVAVLPPGQQDSPRELQHYVRETVAWDGQKIQRAMEVALKRW